MRYLGRGCGGDAERAHRRWAHDGRRGSISANFFQGSGHAVVAAQDGGRRALGRRSPVRRQAIVAGSVRALPWADDAAVRGAFVERAETNAA